MKRVDFVTKKDAEVITLINSLGKKVVYVSMGTQQSASKAKVDCFIEKVFKVSQLMSEFTFVYSSVSVYLKEKYHGKLSNAIFVDTAPQLILLSRSSIFITHGGMNSIRESINFCVPMLICPINFKYDQLQNSVTVHEHKIGIKVSTKDLYRRIYQNLTLLVEDEKYRANLMLLKEKMQKEISFEELKKCFIDF